MQKLSKACRKYLFVSLVYEIVSILVTLAFLVTSDDRLFLCGMTIMAGSYLFTFLAKREQDNADENKKEGE